MANNYDNVIARINQINERIKEIQDLGRKALYGVSRQRSAEVSGEGDKEATFTKALEGALLRQAYEKENTGMENINPAVFETDDYSGREPPFGNIIQLTAQYFGIDSNLIKAVIRQESNFDPNAVSPKGAMGLMQLMPETAKDLGVDEAFDPAKNIYGGTKYLQQMLSRYKGNLDMALAAYNAGPALVDGAQGVPEISETKDYVEKVRKYYREYSKNPLNR